ncbi:hypothetical protein HU200_043605 [Digitaria exilis]|uniref:Protein MEMO1 n=1 Tax=Digitaria exilis TaxID=1010633 RepID=A0A835EHA8_9POAL|nr:hypothetical protein HU200_043605 [Digitaria exilis]
MPHSASSRVFLLSPSHRYYTAKCALTKATVYSTPVGDLRVDQEGIYSAYQLLLQNSLWSGHTVKLVPVLIGSLDSESEATYGQLLGKYLDDTKNLFVVSTDFCHWGSKYKYTYYDENHGPIHKSIEALDRIGMEIIEMLKNCLVKVKVKFIRYDQSSQCNAMEDSSVSYACAVGKVDPSGEDEKKE